MTAQTLPPSAPLLVREGGMKGRIGGIAYMFFFASGQAKTGQALP